jgi:hypothetical protein
MKVSIGMKSKYCGIGVPDEGTIQMSGRVYSIEIHIALNVLRRCIPYWLSCSFIENVNIFL